MNQIPTFHPTTIVLSHLLWASIPVKPHRVLGLIAERSVDLGVTGNICSSVLFLVKGLDTLELDSDLTLGNGDNKTRSVTTAMGLGIGMGWWFR